MELKIKTITKKNIKTQTRIEKLCKCLIGFKGVREHNTCVPFRHLVLQYNSIFSPNAKYKLGGS